MVRVSQFFDLRREFFKMLYIRCGVSNACETKDIRIFIQMKRGLLSIYVANRTVLLMCENNC